MKYFKYLKKLISFFSWKRDIFTLEVPTNCEDEQQKHRLMVDILEILEQEIKLH
tara:strand:+ start:760 stop:921 length:162 start_codon:yes stop_codon:yes gene_type:complete